MDKCAILNYDCFESLVIRIMKSVEKQCSHVMMIHDRILMMILFIRQLNCVRPSSTTNEHFPPNATAMVHSAGFP